MLSNFVVLKSVLCGLSLLPLVQMTEVLSVRHATLCKGLQYAVLGFYARARLPGNEVRRTALAVCEGV